MPAEEGVEEAVVVVVVGGEAPQPHVLRSIPPGATVIAADGGLEHAQALGLDVALAVGDFDSAAPEAVAAAESASVRVLRHPAEKDATDLELALVEALSFAPDRILVLAGVGDRLDHLLSLFATLAAPRFGSVRVEAVVGNALVSVVRGEHILAGQAGELVSLLAVHGAAEGVWTEGLAYELRGETLEPGSSRGVSNVFTTTTARVSVEQGALLAIRPGRAST
jgi:thiamine pyrophosphokinase